MVSFVSVRMHCELCRIQRWLVNTVPPSRKKCSSLVGSNSWTSRSGTRSVRWIRCRLHIETCPNAFSIFKLCFRTQANRCKTSKRNWPSFKQSVPMWLRGVRPQRSRTISRSCCAEPCPSPMKPLVNKWRRWSERPLLFVPDPQGPARPSRCTKICGEGCARAANEAGAVGRVRCKAQRRSLSIITANVTSWRSGRHYLEQELPSLTVIQEHH